MQARVCSLILVIDRSRVSGRWTTTSARRRSTTTGCRSRESWRSSRPSAWPPSATCRSPIRPASPPPARRSSPIPHAAYDYTTRGNLVAVISNGTAVLGLGNIGALAGKPVMEGKAVLFKKFAGIDVFDIEVDAEDPTRFCDVVAALEPTFGAINLEDIKAPECFAIEAELRRRMRIPVFHDDQHGTAITVAAAVRNGLVLQGKALPDVRLVTSGAGAAALACVDLLVSMGLRPENVTLTDIPAWCAPIATGMLPNMARYARDTNARTLQRCAARRRYVPGPLRAARAEAGVARAAGAEAADPGAGQSGAGDPARAGRRAAAGRHRRHRAQRLSQPGQQRPVLSVHLPRRAGCLGHHDQRGDEDRRGGSDRRRWRAWRRPRWSPPPMAVRRRCSVPTTSSPSRSIRA